MKGRISTLQTRKLERKIKKKKNRGRVGRSNGKVEKSMKKRQQGSRNVGGSVNNKVGNNDKKSKKRDRMSWKQVADGRGTMHSKINC